MFNVFLVLSVIKTIVSSTPFYFWVKQVFEKTLLYKHTKQYNMLKSRKIQTSRVNKLRII